MNEFLILLLRVVCHIFESLQYVVLIYIGVKLALKYDRKEWRAKDE